MQEPKLNLKELADRMESAKDELSLFMSSLGDKLSDEGKRKSDDVISTCEDMIETAREMTSNEYIDVLKEFKNSKGERVFSDKFLKEKFGMEECSE